MIKYFCASNDRAMLTKYIVNNPFIKDVEIQLDNNRAKGLPERYNEFIDRNLNSDAWLVFLHDDVELLEDIGPKLEGLPKDIIYGACGAKKTNGKGEIVGEILAQDPRIHNGNKFMFGRRVDGYEIVPTFDPLIVIVHSDLCWLGHMDFDEELGYHLFTEELSISLKKNYSIESAVVQLNLVHYSWGTKDQDYTDAHDYILKKHGLTRFIATPEPQCMDGREAKDWE